MSEKRFELEISSFSGKHMKFLNILDNGKRLNSEEIVDLLNELNDERMMYRTTIDKRIVEQQATIEMYQRRVHKREEQISIIKKHCLKFLTDEQFKIIRKELEDE